MNLITGLFRAARKRLLTTDTDMGIFRDKLNELIEQKDALSEEEVNKRVEELKGFINDLPENDDKAKLGRFLEDFRSVKEQDAAVAKEAGSAVADLFEKLDKEAMQDAPLVEGAAPETTEEPGEVSEETIEEVAEETEAPATDAEPGEEAEIEVDETTEEEATDADPDPEYSLEEIYQFIKKRMAEDAEAGEGTDEEIEQEAEDGADEVEQEEEDEVVADHAPRIPVTVTKGNANKGSLAAMFEEAKRGR